MKRKSTGCLLLLLTFTLSLAACSSSTKTTSVSVSDSDKEKSSQLTEKERDILDNGYTIGEYNFILTETQKSKANLRKEILGKIPEVKERWELYKNNVDTNKNINIIVHGKVYDPDNMAFNLSCFLVNTSKENITSLKMLVRPKFKNINYEEWAEFIMDDNEIKRFLPNEFLTMAISGNLSSNDLPKLKSNASTDITFEIKDLEINGQKVNNTK